jgi:Rv0078B-related antitoxin
VSVTEKYRNNALTTATLMEAGIAMMRENLQRRYPTANAHRINTLLGDWLYRKDDPLPGDTAGQVRIRKQAP